MKSFDVSDWKEVDSESGTWVVMSVFRHVMYSGGDLGYRGMTEWIVRFGEFRGFGRVGLKRWLCGYRGFGGTDE